MNSRKILSRTCVAAALTAAVASVGSIAASAQTTGAPTGTRLCAGETGAVMAPQPDGSCIGGRSLTTAANLSGVLGLKDTTDRQAADLTRQGSLLDEVGASDADQQSAIERVIAGLERVEEGNRTGLLLMQEGESRTVGVGNLRVRFECVDQPTGGRPALELTFDGPARPSFGRVDILRSTADFLIRMDFGAPFDDAPAENARLRLTQIGAFHGAVTFTDGTALVLSGTSLADFRTEDNYNVFENCVSTYDLTATRQ